MSAKRTFIHELHKKLGGKFVEFSGWEMPVQYSNIKEEHLAVRSFCGIFDVSHMGECWIEGPHALQAVNNLVTNDVSKIKPFKAQYNLMCFDDGGVVDDLIVYKFSDEKILLCLNAGNVDKDLQWIRQNVGNAEVRDVSETTGLFSLQGPLASQLMNSLTFKTLEGPSLTELKSFQFCRGTLEGIEVICARTGYTGEDGFEFFHQSKDAAKLWEVLMEMGQKFGLKPIGLGARDTLRLEAALPLYGHELNDQMDPFQANLDWVIKLEKPKFIGKVALLGKKEKRLKTLVGLEMIDPGIARQGYLLLDKDGQEIGFVSSGTYGPSVNKNIALGFKSPTSVVEYVDIRGQKKKIKEIPIPFISKNYKK